MEGLKKKKRKNILRKAKIKPDFKKSRNAYKLWISKTCVFPENKMSDKFLNSRLKNLFLFQALWFVLESRAILQNKGRF